MMYAHLQRFKLIRTVALIALLFQLSACEKQAVVSSLQDRESFSPLNSSYSIEDQEIRLVNGIAENPVAPNAASKMRTQVWGEPKMADINGDGKLDAALILIHSGGGSGTFYYFAAAVNEENSYKTTRTVLLGDRIEPTNIEVAGKRTTINYLDRAPGEAFSVKPTLAKQQIIIYDQESGELAMVAQDFEGEADPAVMTLGMKSWVWKKTLYNNDTSFEPQKFGIFTMTFGDDRRVQIGTDCNRMQGAYNVDSKQIEFTDIISTRMFCEDSQEQLFEGMLKNVSSYFFTSRGQLILELQFDSGSMIFQ
jgi:heat shock protein HslJ